LARNVRAGLMTPLNTNRKDLRKFGLVMAGAFAALGAFLWWKGDFTFWPIVSMFFWSLSGFLLLVALALPVILSPFEWIWMRLAHVMGFVMTRVLLTLVYFIAITPLGLIFKVLRKDLLSRKFDRGSRSYWIETEDDGPWTRPDKPY